MDPRIQLASMAQLHQRDPALFIKAIQNDIIAAPTINDPPFGKKKAIYTDWFASGKPIKTIEDAIRTAVLPFYANTHTTTTSSSQFTTLSVRNSRETVARCVNAKAEEAAVIFCGDGSTSAINRVRNVFHLADLAFWQRKAQAQRPTPVDQPGCASCSSSKRTSFESNASNANENENQVVPLSFSSSSFPPSLSSYLPPHQRPVVFLSIQEHHSNLLPWRESCADVVVIGENQGHQLDLEELERQLVLHRDRPLKIGSFSAGSNLTGVLNDTVAMAELLHKYGAFAFFDFAGVGPYIPIDMNPPPTDKSLAFQPNHAYKDGIFLSPHKFLGGPGSSGILVARSEIFSWADRHSGTTRNEVVPSQPGGGTVDMVISGRHKYINSVLAREEAGTPNILATIRAGLVFGLQEIMNPVVIRAKEVQLAAKIYRRLLDHSPAITVLGTPDLDRVAVFSITISVPSLSTPERPMQIHHGLLSTIMNDFFGIEMRGGCMCAGPYASQLLKFDPAKEEAFWDLLMGEKEKDPLQDDSGIGACPLNDTHHHQDLSHKSLKPGFVRFSFSYFAQEKDIEFVLQSLEWVAQHGYLLIPFYKINAQSGEWSLRRAVQLYVCPEISSMRLHCGSRKFCMPAAVDCIHGLRKLFRAQANLQALVAHAPSPPPSPSLIARLSSTGHDSGNITDDETDQCRPPGWGLPSSSSDISLAQPSAMRLRRRLSTHSIQSTTSSFLYPPCSDMDQPPTPARRHSSDLNRPLPPLPQQQSKALPRKKVFAALSAISIQKSKALQAALEELTTESLQAELEAIESSPLAKQLRWFLTPMEVAQLYKEDASLATSSLASSGSSTFSSSFSTTSLPMSPIFPKKL